MERAVVTFTDDDWNRFARYRDLMAENLAAGKAKKFQESVISNFSFA